MIHAVTQSTHRDYRPVGTLYRCSCLSSGALMPVYPPGPFDHIWFWKYQGPPWRVVDRKGQRCRILVRGSKNSVLVEFEDGFKVVCAKWAVRPAKENDDAGKQTSFFETL